MSASMDLATQEFGRRSMRALAAVAIVAAAAAR
jgi:hypothetical protein